jgi:hypothetical protein
MSQPNVIIGNTEGLATHPNELTARPGTVSVADNVEFAREGVAQRRKGFKNFSTGLPDYSPDQLIACNGTSQPYLHLDGGIWYLDTSDNTWKRKDGSSVMSTMSHMWIANDGVIYGTSGNNVIVSFDPETGIQRIVAGTHGVSGITDGGIGVGKFNSPVALVGDNAGNLYVTESANFCVRKVVIATGVISVYAGTIGSTGSATGGVGVGRFAGPRGIAYDPNDGSLYVVDATNYSIRKVNTSGVISNFGGTIGVQGTTDGVLNTGRLFSPYGIWYDDDDVALYITDFALDDLRQIVIGGSESLTTLNSSVSGALNSIRHVFSDIDYVYVCGGSGSGKIYRVTKSDNTSTAFMGSGVVTADASGTTFLNCALASPWSMVKDSSSNFWIVSAENGAPSLLKAYSGTGTVSVVSSAADVSSGVDSYGQLGGFLQGPS